MKPFYIRKVLDENQANIIKCILNQANEKKSWQDGLKSVVGYKNQIKNNFELSDVNFSKEINNLIMIALDHDTNFLNYTAAKSTHLNIISKTVSGGYYNPHFDNWINGDYSTTLFLNNSDEYIGGELCLLVGDEEKKIKLDSGWAVTYPTGTIHRVNKVISGVRYVSVFWTESYLKDPFISDIHHQISLALNILLKENNNSVHLSNCLSAQNNVEFILSNLKNEILRKYGAN